MVNNNINYKAIMLYLVLVFFLPLISVFLIKKYTVFQSGFLNFVFYGFEAITPTISALLALEILYGKVQTRQFIKKCFISNINIQYIILALILPFIIFILTAIFCLIFLNISIFNTNISIQKSIIILWSLVSEEIGWRGFLQEKLDEHMNIYFTPLVIGIIWSLWHYHFFILGFMSVPLLLFILGCIADSYGYYWLTKRAKGNIIPASIWHFSGNLFFSIFLIYPQYNHGNIIPYLFFIILSVIMAGGITVWGILSTKK
jgi:membrane protease YdiL (CAAX protease family)